MFIEVQRQLAVLMSDMSEAAYFARWLDGTEYRLWSCVAEAADDGQWGNITVDRSSRDQLRSLSAEAGGWIYFDSDKVGPSGDWGLTFVTKAEWLPIYEAEMARLQRAG